MAMTKKEKEALESALTAAALRHTSEVVPDVPIPSGGEISFGWAIRGDYVGPAWSEACRHGYGEKPSRNTSASQGGRALFSTQLLATQALRYKTEQRFAAELRKIDLMIEEAKKQ